MNDSLIDEHVETVSHHKRPKAHGIVVDHRDEAAQLASASAQQGRRLLLRLPARLGVGLVKRRLSPGTQPGGERLHRGRQARRSAAFRPKCTGKACVTAEAMLGARKQVENMYRVLEAAGGRAGPGHRQALGNRADAHIGLEPAGLHPGHQVADGRTRVAEKM